MQQSQQSFNQIMQCTLTNEQKEEMRKQAEARRLEQEADRQRIAEFTRQQAELQKQEAELRRLEVERKEAEEQAKKEEMESKALLLQAELEGFIGVAEAKLSVAVLIAEPFKDTTPATNKMDDEEILEAAKSFETSHAGVREALKACATFSAGKLPTLSGVMGPTKKSAADLIGRVGKAERSLHTAFTKVKAHASVAEQRKAAQQRKDAAAKEAQRLEALFKQFDTDSDGILNAANIVALCKAEYDFKLSEERLEGIKKSDAFKGTEGVPFIKFAQLRTLIGIARGEVLAKERKEESERRRVRAQEQLKAVKKNTATVDECMSGIETEVAKAENKALPLYALQRSKAHVPMNIESSLDAVETAADAARDFIAAAQEQLELLGGQKEAQLEPETQQQMKQTVNTIGLRLKHFETRLQRACGVLKFARDKLELQQRKEALLREAAAME